MPTGLTAEIYEGKNTSFRRFALRCATQFGGGYQASNYGESDLPLDKAPVLEASNYHLKMLDHAYKELAKWKKLQENPEEAHNEVLEKRKQEAKDCNEHRNDHLRNYEDMLTRVKCWHPDERYTSIKEFMIKQLEESIEHDCSYHGPSKESLEETTEQWLKCNIDCCEWDIKYHEKAFADEIKSIEKTNEFLQGFYDSLDEIEPYRPARKSNVVL